MGRNSMHVFAKRRKARRGSRLFLPSVSSKGVYVVYPTEVLAMVIELTIEIRIFAFANLDPFLFSVAAA